jgi:hypothetical protein
MLSDIERPSHRNFSRIYLASVWVIAGFLVGCNPKYAAKHREYTDPDDELYGAIQSESLYAQMQKSPANGLRKPI